MKNMEHYKKVFFRAGDQSFNDKRESLLNVPNSLYQIVRPDSNRVKRLSALFGIIRQALPEEFWQTSGVSNMFRSIDRLPLDLINYQMKHRIGSGHFCDCFLFEPRDNEHNETYALKVFQDGGKGLAAIEKRSKQVKEDYETIKDWYKDMPGVIPEQFLFIAEHFQLPKGRPALFVLQKFLGDNVKDVAIDFTDTEWETLCLTVPHIKEELKKFTQITKDNIEKFGKVPDLLGDSNLVLAGEGDCAHIFFLDPDGIDVLNSLDPTRGLLYEERLKLLYKRTGIN